jgi:hypothetical protein
MQPEDNAGRCKGEREFNESAGEVGSLFSLHLGGRLSESL